MIEVRNGVAFAALAVAVLRPAVAQDDDARAKAERAARRAIQGGLVSNDAVRVELARRRALGLDAADVPVRFLTQLLRHPDPARRWTAATVLAHHRLGADAARRALFAEIPARGDDASADDEPFFETPRGDAVGLARAVLAEAFATTADLRKLATSDASLFVRHAALCALHDRRELTDDDVLALLRDKDAAVVALTARLLVEEVAPLPIAVFGRVADRPVARRALLVALAERPRAAAAPWIEGQLDVARPPIERMLALAALDATRWTPAHAREILDALCASADDRELAIVAADNARRLPAALADDLVQRVIERVGTNGVPLSDVLQALETCSPSGLRLLRDGFVERYPSRLEEFVDWLDLHADGLVAEMVAETLRTAAPREFLVRRAARLAGRDAFVREQLVELLDDDDVARHGPAFHALLEAAVWDPKLVDFALAIPELTNTRTSRLIGSKVRLPVDAVERLLRSDSSHVALAMLGRVSSPAEVEAVLETLVELGARDHLIGDRANDRLLRYGSREVAESAWARLDDEGRKRLVMAWTERDEDWVRPLLGPVPDAPDPSRVSIVWTQAMCGDVDALQLLLTHLDRWPRPWFRRFDDAVERTFAMRHVPFVERWLVGVEPLDESGRMALTEWLAKRPDLDLTDLLAQVHRTDESPWVREVAHAALLRSRRAPEYRAAILTRAAAGDGLDDDIRDELMVLLASLEAPWSDDETALIARVVLELPLLDPEREVAANLPTPWTEDPATIRGLDPADLAFQRQPAPPGGTPGLPTVNYVWRAARGGADPALVAALARGADRLPTLPNAYASSRARLGVLLGALIGDDAARVAIGPPLARALVASPDADPRYLGPAAWLLGEDHERAGRFDAAATAYADATRALLRTPPPPVVWRALLGDDHRAEGYVTRAAVAARGPLCRARHAWATGDRETARAELVAARDLATGDRQTLAEIDDLQESWR